MELLGGQHGERREMKKNRKKERESEMRSWYKNGQPVENWRHFKQRCLLFRTLSEYIR
ncbi:Uncharacterized protein APZ42_018640 [Daphnia magna]|uniref:Uncharacterized protein n=1 Tax=Daphnia magna TaxID=35525 RepID=A0A164YPC6_9CRUS|nr:Uncharacterized protein APZ42_018640 [Daphnia magna]